MLTSMTFRSTLAVACAKSMPPHAIPAPLKSNNPNSTSDSSSQSSSSSSSPTQLEEILITAQKREERLQDVPIPVSVVSTTALTENNQVKLTDFYAEVPGLSIAP